MTTRQKLIRFPFLSLAVGSPAAADSSGAEWSYGLAPFDGREALNGQQVELHAWGGFGGAGMDAATPVWFDVLDESFLLSGSDADRIARVASEGASPPPAAFPSSETRTPVFGRLAAGETLASFVETFRREHPDDYARWLLIVEEPAGEGAAGRFHALTWWNARRSPGALAQRLTFEAHLGEAVSARAGQALPVSSAPAEAGTLQFALQYEDGSPMPDAEIQVVFEGRTLLATSGADGVARLDAPVGDDEAFTVFLLSFPQQYPDVPDGPTPPAPPARLDPEVVTVFAFDSSFPVPAVYAALMRVRDQARANPGVQVRLYGHTDPQGSETYNQALSERRAKTVLALLTNDLALFDEVAAAERWDTRHDQAMLRGLGCNPGAIDGQDGAMTREAVRRFQSEYNLFGFHRGVERRHGELAEDGSLNSATRAALRDAYVAWSPHLPAGRLTDPPFVGCGETHLVSSDNWENRRVTVAYRNADDLAAESGDLCAQYRAAVSVEQEHARGPRFVDFEWLREESGAVHLSALTALPESAPAQFTIYPQAQPLPWPAPDSSTGQPRPAVDGPAEQVSGQISGGVAFARWNPGAAAVERIFDYTAWLVDHDFAVEIAEDDADAPEAGSPGSAESLWQAAGMRPPVFSITSGEHWGFSDPPGQPLQQVHLANAVEGDGVALRADGALVRFSGAAGWLEQSAAKEGGAAAPDSGEPAGPPEEAQASAEPETGFGGEAADAPAPGEYGWAETSRPTFILAMAMVGQGLELAAPLLAQVAPAPAAPAVYGGYDLRRDDQDGNHTYAGAARSARRGDPLPAAGANGFVRQLQEDLFTLGYKIVGPRNGVFTRQTEWAVREFQIYAKMSHIAQENAASTATVYADRLAQVANTDRYAGPVSGVANARTRALIQTWLANRWRCPVVIEAWSISAGARSAIFNHHDNVWLHNEVASSAPRFFARDFTRYYTFPATRNAADRIVLGDFVTYLTWSGPRSLPPNHTWTAAPPANPTADGEMLPEGLVGVALATLTPAQRSTYKVVRAVSEVECIGFFDSLNAYDNAFMSLGPCHWTLGIVSGSTVSGGELCGYLAYLRNVDAAAFTQAIEFFGMRVNEDWLTPAAGTAPAVANGRNLFNANLRNYTGRVAVQQENSTFTALPLNEDEWNYFKSWHWFYRFQMAGRTIDGFRRRMWDMARVRLRDIRALTFPAGTVPNIPIPAPAAGGGAAATRLATVGDVFTSEKAMALLLRWHIRFPAHITGNNLQRLRNVITHAGIPASAGNPTTWTDAHEASLIAGIFTEVNAIANSGFTDTMNYVNNWPAWAAASAPNPRRYALANTIGGLATTRSSFNFDAAGLPPAP